MTYRMANGYRAFYEPDNPMADCSGLVYEHRIIAAKKLGRYLTKEETVHHIDGNKLNNSIENLMIFKTKGDHVAYHHGCIAILENDVYVCQKSDKSNKDICPICKTNFKNYKAKTCIYCARELQKCNSKKPTKDKLKEELSILNYTAIGKKYNVSASAVKKWAISYGIIKNCFPVPPEINELSEYMQNHSISSAAKKYSVDNNTIKHWMKQYSIPFIVEKIKCDYTGEIFDSGRSAIRSMFPEEKHVKSKAEKLLKAIKNNVTYMGMPWGIIKESKIFK